MQAAGLLSGGAPVIKKYKSSATGYIAGTVFIVPAANASGFISVSTTTSWTGAVGLNVDGYALAVGAPLTYSTTQGDAEALSSIIVNPDLILRMLMVGTAVNAVLVDNPILTASTDGLTAVGTNSVSNLDEGTAWYTSGANVSASRKITSVATATVTVISPFPQDDAVGDIFLAINTGPGQAGLTTGTNLLNLLQANTALQGAGTTGRCLDLELNGNSNSYAHMIMEDHFFSTA